eukprot:IDg22614t1
MAVVLGIYGLGKDALRDTTTKENSNFNWSLVFRATAVDSVKVSTVVILNSGFSVLVIWHGFSEHLRGTLFATQLG